MGTLPASDPRRLTPWIIRFAFVTIAFAGSVVLSTPAMAGLIVNSVRFDGHVRNNNGNGAITGVEKHFTADSFPPPTSNQPLPATNPPLPAGLDASNNLRMQFDFSANAPLNGDTFRRATIWITSPRTGDVFANDLDNMLATPVEFETFVYLEELTANEKLIFEGVRIESGDLPPFPSAAVTDISSNAGSAADPIRIQLSLAKNQVSFGLLKVHLYYDTTAQVIPEPATSVLLLGTTLGAVAMRIRRRSI